MLHILSCSPWYLDIKTILKLIKVNDDLIFIQDGVLATIKNSNFIKIFTKNIINMYALETDIKARGISDQISDKIVLVDYNYFVDLVVKNKNQINW